MKQYLVLVLLSLATGFLIVKREQHLEDRPDRGVVWYYNLLITVVVGALILYAVLAAG